MNDIADNIPKELLEKTLIALNYNVDAMGRSVVIQTSGYNNQQLYEICFDMTHNGELTEDYYNLMRSVELEENESPDEFNLIYYNQHSIVNYLANFVTMSDSFLSVIQQQTNELIELFKTIMGVDVIATPHETLEDMIDSMFYDGDNYFLRAIVGDDSYYKKVMIIADPMLNIETKNFFFKFRYFIGHDSYANFEDMKKGFINKFVNLPEGKTQEYFWDLSTNENKKDVE